MKFLNLTTVKIFKYIEHLERIKEEANKADDRANELWHRVEEVEANPNITNEEADKTYDDYEEAYKKRDALNDKAEAWERAIELLKELDSLENYIQEDCEDYTFSE
jgi:chromosome segregation ATPase